MTDAGGSDVDDRPANRLGAYVWLVIGGGVGVLALAVHDGLTRDVGPRSLP